jgi:site-specific DNA recombinase
MKQPAAYLRVSTLDQKKRETIKTQKEGLVAFFKEKGLLPNKVLWYSDEAVSGAVGFDSRGDSARLLEDVEAGKIEYLAVYSMSRLSRSEEYDIFTLFVKLREFGIPIRSISEGVDTEAEGGMFMAELLGLLAINERRKLKKLLQAGKLRKAKEGSFHGKAPFGYKRDSDSLKIDEEELPFVRFIYRTYITERISSRKISRRLLTLAPQYNWSQRKVDYILNNSTYYGKAYYNTTRRLPNGKQVPRPRSDWIEIEVPAIIDEETWHDAQRVRKLNLVPRTGRAKREFLLGAVVCGNCSSNYWRAALQTNYYKHNPRSACKYRANHIRAEEVDLPIWNRIEQAICSPSDWQEYIGNLAPEQSFEDELAQVYKQLEAITKRQKKADNAYFVRESISDEHYDKLTRNNREQKANIEARIKELEAKIAEEGLLYQKEAELEELLREIQTEGMAASMEERRLIADKLINKVVISFNENNERILAIYWMV